MSRIAVQKAYPGISFRPRSLNWWARLMRWPAECIHVGMEHAWLATVIPDTIYLRGKPKQLHQPARPEVSLCLDCTVQTIRPELASYQGRVVAFEPDAEAFTQYFFVGSEDFAAAGLRPEIAGAIAARLQQINGTCAECGAPASWVWISRREVSNLDQTERIENSPGSAHCSRHGAAKLCDALGEIAEANLFYVNVPYGEAGAYVWI